MKFEIVLSTMFRENLSFLEAVFQEIDIENYNVLVINQTDATKKPLVSNKQNIRVINSFEKGTSASRNLGIQNCKAEIGLFADDDTILKNGLEAKIVTAFHTYTDAGIITFECVNSKGIPHTSYPEITGEHTLQSLANIHTIVIAFRKNYLHKKNILFNPYFSYKGYFSGGGEYVFLVNAYLVNTSIFHVKNVIVEHPSFSSGKAMASLENIRSRAAKSSHYYGCFLAYVWLVKYLLFLWRKDYITFSEISTCFYHGRKALKDYQALYHAGKIKRQPLLRHLCLK